MNKEIILSEVENGISSKVVYNEKKEDFQDRLDVALMLEEHKNPLVINTTPVNLEKRLQAQHKKQSKLEPSLGEFEKVSKTEIPPQNTLDEEEEKDTTIGQAFTEWGTNLKFQFDKMLASNQVMVKGGVPAIRLFSHAFQTNTQNFHAEFESYMKCIFWITYRTHFHPLLKTKVKKQKKYLTSDAGWGCMIRVGQMAIANCLVRHVFGRQATFVKMIYPITLNQKYKQILTQFWDNGLGEEFSFSIQNIAEIGLKKYRKKPGEWVGQSTITGILSELNAKYNPFPNLQTMCFPDGIIYKDQIMHQCGVINSKPTKSQEEEEFYMISKSEIYQDKREEIKEEFIFKPVIIFVTIRLGLNKIDVKDQKYIFQFFDIPNNCGILGGSPRKAFFFIGYQGKSILYLDPHFVQKATNYEDFLQNFEQYHTIAPKRISIEKIDSTMALALYIRDLNDLNNCLNLLHDDFKEVIQVSDVTPEFILDELEMDNLPNVEEGLDSFEYI